MSDKTPLQVCLDLLNESTANAVTDLYIEAKKQSEPPKIMLIKHTCIHVIDSKWDVIYGLLKNTDTPIQNIEKMHQENRLFRLLMETEFDALIERAVSLETMNDLYI